MNRPLVIGLALSAALTLIPVTCHRAQFSDSELLEFTPEYSTEALSPYDDILRQVADSTGWDWRLLASVVYHESRFHNEAKSARGATGLMQIRSEKYSEEMLLDPRTNITVGARYLKRLQGEFTTASPVEGLKFALAAYNLGEGRVGRLVSQAAEEGADTTRWDSVSAYLPQGHRTVKYVEIVLEKYVEYAHKYPR